MTVPPDLATPTARRGGLIVPFLEVEPLIEPWLARYLETWKLGVPAHVTLLFPFLMLDQLDAEGLAYLSALFASTPPVGVTFAQVGQFPEVVYLAPEPRAWFVGLTEALSARFGLLPYGGQHAEIIPHLTVAQRMEPIVQAEIVAELRCILPIEATVREVWLMEEDPAGLWHRAATFPVGQPA